MADTSRTRSGSDEPEGRQKQTDDVQGGGGGSAGGGGQTKHAEGTQSEHSGTRTGSESNAEKDESPDR